VVGRWNLKVAPIAILSPILLIFYAAIFPFFISENLIWLETKKNEFKNKILPGLWAENARRVFA
jgi:hypothetical protein